MSQLKREKIAVLAGGPSCEREISLISGQAVFDALSSQGWKVSLIDPVDGFLHRLKRDRVSKVFLALHGTFGEDGTVQKILDEGGMAYTGSNAKASELAFDKAKAQTLFQKSGLRVPRFLVLTKHGPQSGLKDFSLPCVVKPSCCGSSVGISIVFKKKDIREACELAFRYSDTLLIEEYVHGRELTVSILGDEPLPIVEVIPKRKFYDYEAKYGDSGTRYEFPAKLAPEKAWEISQIAVKAHRLLGCRAMSRVDLILSDGGIPYVLEVNTIPGLTGKSLLPKAAEALGIDFPNLCVKILELSFNGKR